MSRQPQDRPANLPLEALLQSARELEPKLDELSAARIEARLASQLAAHRARPRNPRHRYAAIVALAAAAALALLWFGRSARAPLPAATPQVARHDAAPKRVTTAAPTRDEPALLTVYCIAGADAESPLVRALLGRPVSRIELPRAAVLRAALGSSTRLSVQGPGTLRVASESAEHSVLELDAGQVVADFEGDGERQLSVQTPHARVHIVGTRFAIDVRRDRSVVHVEHGTVQVQWGEHSVRVSDGETFDSREQVVRRRAAPPTLARMLRDHARALHAPPTGEQRVLSVEGAGAGMRARLGDALLGPTPVAALVPLGEVAVTLETDPHSPKKSVSVRAHEPPTEGDAEALYAAAEDCMRAAEPACARARLARLIEDFAASPQAATARYELAKLVQGAEGCTAAAPLWSDYLRLHPAGYFATAAREQLAQCKRDSAHRALP